MSQSQQVQSANLKLLVNVLYYSVVSLLSCLVIYTVFSSLNEFMNSYYSNKATILKMEYKLKSFSTDVLSTLNSPPLRELIGQLAEAYFYLTINFIRKIRD